MAEAGAGAGAGLGLPGLGVLLAAMEAGVPIPVPSESAKGPATAGLALVAVGGIVLWVRRRGSRRGAEACCPACLTLGLLVPKLAGLEDRI